LNPTTIFPNVLFRNNPVAARSLRLSRLGDGDMRFTMRRLFPGLCLFAALAINPARAQDSVQEFSGSGSTTTALFKVGDRWEIRWNARQAISVAAMSADGTLVAGGSGVLRGSLFVPAGGQYYLKISDGTVAPAPPPAKAAPASGTNAPSANPPIVTDKPAEPAISWHVQVVQLAPTVASTEALTVYTPYFIVPYAAVTAVTPPPAPPPPTLTPEQLRALVTIKGDNAQGNGFLVRSADGVFVASHLHLLAANPNIAVFSSSGAPIKILSVKAATDRDLAMIAVRDDHFSCLPLPATADNAAPDDQVIIPAVGEGDGTAGKVGKIINLNADRIDFDTSVNAASLGAPLIRVKGGDALGLVTAEKKVDLSEEIAKGWQANPAPGSATIFPFYALRLKGVAGWELLDLGRFLTETQFLKDFHETTRCLDSYLNGRRHRSYGLDGADGPPDSHYYANNAKLVSASDTYKKFALGADRNQGLDAARELLFDLEAVADSDVDQLQASNGTYAFDRLRAQEELAYRKAIRSELDQLSDNIPRLDTIARAR
jgi:hypothetical protein